MVDRFVDYFGLETKEVSKSGSARFYTVQIPEDFDNFIIDIDKCLETRAKNVIAEAKEISLKASADKAEEAQRQRQELEQRHQAELDKQRLATEGKNNCQSTDGFGTSGNSNIYNQESLVPTTDIENTPSTEKLTNCQSTDGFGTSPHSFIYNQESLVPTTDTQNILLTQKWSKPEDVENIASFLAACESRDMLRELRECDIPPLAFKQACKHLQATKRKQIKQWVLELNEIV